MALLALVAASQASHFSVLQSSIIGSSLFGAAALSALWKGKIVDEQGRGVVVQQAQLLALIFVVLLGAFLWAPWWVAALGAFALGCMRFNPAALQQALWSEYHQNENTLSRAMAWENIVSFSTQIVGPLLTALVIWALGGYAAIAVAGFLTVFSMGVWGMLAPSGGGSASSGGRFIWAALPVVATLFLISFSSGIVQGVLLHEGGGALLIALYTSGAAAAGFYFFRRPLPREWIGGALWISPLLLFVVAISHSTALAIPALLIAGGLFSIGTLAANIKIKSLSPKGRLNEAFSLPLLAGPLGISLGVLASGFMVAGSWQVLAVVLSLGIMLAAWLLGRSWRLIHRRTTFSTRQAQTR